MTWAPPPLLFPDVELLLTTRLRALIDARPEPYAWAVFVGNAVPKQRRDRMVIVRRDGGNRAGHRDNARVGLNVWAPTEQEATDLARLVAALMYALPTGAPILAVTQLSGPTPIAEESKQSRRYLVFEVATRGTSLQGA